jgi:hypothetical protein
VVDNIYNNIDLLNILNILIILINTFIILNYIYMFLINYNIYHNLCVFNKLNLNIILEVIINYRQQIF